ncbi:S-layer homology domain-containing protein [Lysinibacillus sp. LZ02]|uniref:S-layer homology domain-containing protein n=1 Tax=Lysinibacillus sp. LZ02 TaxID=3420668 RepID=UPI003D35DCF9
MKNSNALSDKIFKTAMATVMATSAIAVVAPEATKANTNEAVFKDVKASSDYYEYVSELFERGFVNGYSDGSFNPTGLLTRAQAAKILALNLGLDVNKPFNITFKDVPKGDWAYPYIAALKEEGILDGYQDGTFKPNAPITRNQIAKIIVNGYKLQPASTITLPFTDVLKADWAAPYIQTLFDLGITIGQTATTYGGNATVTRANMAAFTIRSEMTTDYRDNRRPDENVITSIDGNKMTIGGQVYYIKKELQPLLHSRNLAALNEANLDFIKIGTKVVGIRNLALLNGGTADNPLMLDLAGSTVEANITVVGDHIQLVNGQVVGDVTIKNGDQQHIGFSGLDIDGRLIVEGQANREGETVVQLSDSTADEIIVNRDETKIITDNKTPAITVGNHVSEIEVVGKISAIDFVGNQDVFVKGNLDTNELTIETPIKVTLENQTHLPQVETKQYGSQLIVPQQSTIGTLIKPDNVEAQEAVTSPTGGLPPIGEVVDTSDIVRPPTTTPTTPPSTGGSENSGGGYTNPFVSQILETHNVVDEANADSLAVGMIGTTVTTSNPNVATATLEDGKIKIKSVGVGTAIITVKEDVPSLKEAQIIVTVDGAGKITHTIKRPLEVAQEKIKAEQTPALEELVKLYEGVNIQGITPTNVAEVTAKVKQAIDEKGQLLTGEQLKLTVDIALLPEQIKKDNPSIQQVSTPLELQAVGPNGTAFTWKPVTAIDGATVDHVTGNVTRSDNDDVNDTVVLGITATNGSVTKEAAIDATILEAKPPYLVSVTVNDKDNSSAISAGDEVTLLFNESLSAADRKKAFEAIFGTNHRYGENATLVWTDNQTAVITLGTNQKVQFGDTLTPDVTDAQGNPYIDSGNTMWKSVTFQPQTDNTTNNLRNPLGIKGTTVSTNNPHVATAAIVDGKVAISSVGPGKATIAVANGNDIAMIDVTVGLDGSISIDQIHPFVGDVKLDILILAPVPQASQGTWEEALLGAGSTAPGGPYNEDFPYIGNGQFLEAERFAKNDVYGGPELNDSDFTFKVASAKNQPNDLDTTNFMKLLNASNPETGEGIYRVHINEDGQSMNATYFVDVLGKVGTGFAGYYQQFSYTTYGNNVTSVITARHNGSSLQVVWDFKDLANIASQDIYLLTGDEWNQNDVPAGNPIGTVNGTTFEWNGAVTTDSAGNPIVQGQDYTVIVVKKNAADQPIAYDNFGHYAINTKVSSLTTVDTSAIDAIANNLTDVAIRNANPSLQEVKTALSLPVEFEGATIEWSSTTVDGATIQADGTVVRSNVDHEDDVVTLTATIRHGGLTTTKTFQVTVKESKTPTVTAAVLQDTNADNQPSAGENIELTFSEPIQSFDKLSINGQEIAKEQGTWNAERTKWTGKLSTDVGSTGTIVTVTNIKDDNDNETAESEIALTIASVNTIKNVETVDRDANGKLDGLKVTLSEGIKDTTVNAANFAITGGYSNLGFDTGSTADDNEIYITFDEKGDYDTDQTPTLTYTQGTLTDLAGNNLATTEFTSLDKASPVLVVASISDEIWSTTGDTLTLTYSEAVNMYTSAGAFVDRYNDSDGHQIYFPQIDALIGLDTAGAGMSGNALKTTFGIVTLQTTAGSRITVEVDGDKVRLIIIHDDFVEGGVPNNAEFNIVDRTINEITDSAGNKLKHTVKTITVTSSMD